MSPPDDKHNLVAPKTPYIVTIPCVLPWLTQPEEEPEEAIVVKRRKTDKEGTSSGVAKCPEAKRVKEVVEKKTAQPNKWQTIGDGNLLVCEVRHKCVPWIV